MSSDFGAPGVALSSYRPVGDVESLGVRSGPFTIRAAVHSGVGYDDNVNLSEANKISSMFFTVSPSFAVGLEGALHRYHAIYRGNFGRYASSSEDNYEDHNFSAQARDDWTTRLRTLVNYDFLRGHNPRGSTTAGTTTSERWDWQSIRGSAAYGAEGAQGHIEGSFGWSGRRYLTNRAVNAVNDYEQVDGAGTFSYRLAPKTRALVSIRRAEFTHDSDRTRDSTEMRYLVGLTWEALAKTQGTVRVGHATREVSDATQADYSGTSYDLAVTWSPRTYSSVVVSARREPQESPDAASVFIVATSGGAVWTHNWSERTLSTVSYNLTRQDLRGLGRTDTYHDFALRASYALRRWLRVGAEYRYDMRDSEAPGGDFRRNLTLFNIEAAL